MIACPQCSHQLPEGSKFCSQCGTRLGQPNSGETTHTIPAITDDTHPLFELSDDVKSAVTALPAGSALLVVTRGPDAGAKFLLDSDEVVAGRHPKCDIFLDDITVSRRHAKFTRSGQGYAISDMGSLNGTYVNRAVTDATTQLRHLDQVQIGKYRMVFCLSEAGTR